MKERLKQLRSFNWQLFAALCAAALIPAIYQTVKTFIISYSTDVSAFDVIGQMEWFDLINETLQAFLVVPLYSVLNKIFVSDNENFAKYTFKTGLLTVVIYSLFSVGVLLYGTKLIAAMNPADTDIAEVSTYLRLETVAFMAGIVATFANVVFVVVGKAKNVYIFLAINTLLSVIADFVLIPAFGVRGVAISNIAVNALLAVAAFLLLYFQKHIRFCLFRKDDLPVMKNWLVVGLYSGAQQFVDNFVYAVMVCKMVNAVSEQGNYWIANNFIWGWLLIPITALTEVIRRDCKDGYENLHRFNYIFVAAATVLLWIISLPLWIPFFRFAENLPNANEIFVIALKLAPFYIAYIGCAIIDNIFVGLGKTMYNMINSLIINIVYYGIFYILYVTGALHFSLDVIILMFGFGMVMHLLISIAEEKLFLKKRLTRTNIKT